MRVEKSVLVQGREKSKNEEWRMEHGLQPGLQASSREKQDADAEAIGDGGI
jgi:hypothetical protein